MHAGLAWAGPEVLAAPAASVAVQALVVVVLGSAAVLGAAAPSLAAVGDAASLVARRESAVDSSWYTPWFAGLRFRWKAIVRHGLESDRPHEAA